MTNPLFQLIKRKGLITAPGAFDGLSAKLTEQDGFNAVYASGGAIARSTGVPDIGLLTLTEVAERIRQIVDSVDIPVIADADTGFGNEINVKRTVELFASIGVSALHIEDQEFPKRCGHLDGKSLISSVDMCNKIKIAKKYAGEMLIIARTDAISVDGFDEAIIRANEYLEAGADMIFVEAPESVEQIEQISIRVKGPKLINMFHSGKTPLVSSDRLKSLGYQLIIIPSDLQRASMKAISEVLGVILKKGNSGSMESKLVSFKEREEVVQTNQFLNP
jgi:2-methylisocitrate lyase-like PEP mutase family enzyme